MIDLHLHSTYSDGELTPSELVRKAKHDGISVLSLTDHDSIAGINEAKLTCEQLGIQFIPGVELEASTDISRSRYIHILGYNFSNLKILEDYLNNLRRERIEVINKYIEKLNHLGIHTSFNEIASITPGSHITAYHIPMFLYKEGYFDSFSEAKKTFINPGSKYYIPRNFYDVNFIIDLIIQAGGIPVLAHPCRLPQKDNDLKIYVADLKQKGILGIETYYSEHSNNEIAFYELIAKENNLLQTAGSDWHSVNSAVKLGISIPNEDEIVSNLLNCKGNS